MPGYVWEQAKTTISHERLIERLNQHFQHVVNLFAGIVQVPSGYRVSQFLELPLLTTAPDAPTEGVRLYTILNGGGKTELRARFPTGATQVISTEP